MKIADKIGISFLVVSLMMTSSAASFFYTVSKNNLFKSINANLDTAVTSRTRHIETYLKMLKSSVLELSTSSVLENFITINGKEDPRYAESLALAIKMIKRAKEANPSMAEFLLMDRQGRVLISNEQTAMGRDMSMDALFLGGKNGTYLKDIYYSQIDKEPVLAVATPFLNSQTGEWLGVIGAKVRLKELNDIVTEKTGLGETGEIYIVNQYGYMITPARFNKDTVLRQRVDTENFKQARLQADRESTLLRKEKAWVFLNYCGEQVLGGYEYIPLMNWAVLAEIDTKEALAPLAKLRTVFLWILFLVPIVSWVLGKYMAVFITKTLHRLSQGAEIIGRGNLDYRVGKDIETKDEVGQLALAFDSMTVNLQKTTVSRDALIKEIDERKKAEEKIREDSQFLKSVLDSLNHPFYIIDANNYTIKMANAAARSFHGCVSAATTCYAFTHNRDTPCKNNHICPLEEVKKTKKSVVVEHLHSDADGNTKYVEVRGHPILDADGNVVEIIEYSVDITERKQAEKSLREMNQALEKSHRELKESTVQLVQAAKLSALGELTAGVAHELNQPLNVTKIICQGILRDIQKNRFSLEEAQKDLPEVVNQMNRMAEIITHMRIYSRRTEGIVREEHDISALICGALKFIGQQLRDHNITLVENLAPGLPHVMVDQIRIEQVCINLLNNARYAVENSGKTEMKVEIKTYSGSDGKEVVIEISDNGIGIPDSVKDKIFQPFFTTKDPGKGTGLGLSVCHQIVAEHKGRLEFVSKEGEGTVFRLVLPANDNTQNSK